jgi:hypothetical protein
VPEKEASDGELTAAAHRSSLSERRSGHPLAAAHGMRSLTLRWASLEATSAEAGSGVDAEAAASGVARAAARCCVRSAPLSGTPSVAGQAGECVGETLGQRPQQQGLRKSSEPQQSTNAKAQGQRRSHVWTILGPERRSAFRPLCLQSSGHLLLMTRRRCFSRSYDGERRITQGQGQRDRCC